MKSPHRTTQNIDAIFFVLLPRPPTLSPDTTKSQIFTLPALTQVASLEGVPGVLVEACADGVVVLDVAAGILAADPVGLVPAGVHALVLGGAGAVARAVRVGLALAAATAAAVRVAEEAWGRRCKNDKYVQSTGKFASEHMAL